MSFRDYDDPYEAYAEEFDPLNTDRRARRKRKPRPDYKPKMDEREILEDLADLEALEGGLDISYNPGRHEAVWLTDSLRPFFEQDYIYDVLAMVKGGKEASVYRCAAREHTGATMLAAKVYRPRMFRNLRNDKAYREGREVLTQGGGIIKNNDHREMRALNKKTAFGEQVSHTSWLMYEYTSMAELHAAGANVPRPIASGPNAILMSYVGDADMAAPTLNGVDLGAAEAQELFDKVIWNIDLLLQKGKVHGDLSAFNILYWEGEITLIDFPQIIDVAVNTQADHIFKRDVQRVCDYFSGFGLACDALEIAASLWDKHVGFSPNERLRFLETDEDDDF